MRTTAVVAALGLAIAACGSDSDDDSSDGDSSTAATDAAAGDDGDDAGDSDSGDDSSDASGDAVTVSMWWHTGTPEEQEATDAAVEAFNSSRSDIQIDKTDIPGGTYTDQVNAAALAGDLPCVLDFDGPFVYNFAWSDFLIPIDEFVDDETRADFLPSIIEQGTYNGELFSLGQFDSGLGLYANARYLEEVDARIPTFDEPWTLEEFETILADLAEVDGIEFPLDLKINYGQGEWYTYGFSPIVQSFGGDLIDRSDYLSASGTLDGPEAVAALETFQSWFDNGWVDPATPGDDSFFGSETSAISYVGHWQWLPHSEALGEDLLVLPMPNFGGETVTGMGSWNYGITSTCEDPAAAYEVLSHLVSTDEILRMTAGNGAVPARFSALEQSELYQEGGPLEIFAQQLSEGRGVPRPIFPGYATITEEFAQVIADIISGADVQSTLSDAAAAIDQDIEDNSGYPTGS
ncbi:MAG: sugar ABC transporter substrate-binding protein [Actinomycetota bacterium]